MRILAIQPAIQKSSNRQEKLEHVAELAKKVELTIQTQGAEKIDLVALPELTTIEYTKEAFENLHELAEPLTDGSFSLFSKLAKQYSTFISLSLPRKEDKNYYISNIVINQQGELQTSYDKIHIPGFGCPSEKNYFSAGGSISVFRVEDFNIGIIICYDFRFQEYIKFLVDRFNLNLILHPVAFKEDETFPSWHNFVVTRALENQIYFLSINRAGENWGNSIFCSPWIDNQIKPFVFDKKEQYKVFDLNLETLEKVKKIYSFATDRLKDYKNLEVQ